MKIAVLGATGNVGQMILEVLEERNFPVDELYVFSSERSAGDKITFNGKEYTLEALSKEAIEDKDIDIAFLAAGGDLSAEYAPIFAEKGTVCVDNSSHFRMDEEIPLVVPEINGNLVTKDKKLIANPNCSTIQSVMVLKPLENYGIKRVIYNTYQSVSGSGAGGIRDLEEGVCEQYPYNIQNNCLPHIDEFTDNGYTLEELKMINETKKILEDDSIEVTATTVRVPIFNGHAVSLNIEFEEDFDLDEVRDLLSDFPGIKLVDYLKNNKYPLAETVNGTDYVEVGRIRRDFSQPNTLNCWCTADNIRKGAATNTVQIAELLVK